MSSIFKKLALGLAFSPRVEALLAECARLKKEWDAELVLIHVGAHGTREEEKLEELLLKVDLTKKDLKVFWEQGEPSKKILEVCKKEKVDLLITGALKKENLVQYYLGTIARNILRKANCSVLMLVNPSEKETPLKNIVVNAEGSPFVKTVLNVACKFGHRDPSAWLHIVKELKLYSLTMSVSDQYSEQEYEEVRHKLVQEEIDSVYKSLEDIPHEGLKINVKLVSGKSGFELSKFAIRKNADLLIVGAPRRKFFLFDRLFTHDLEYIFADLPCNLLLVKPGKEVPRG
jgi:nucleotide-binding universal stress UspA family protein